MKKFATIIILVLAMVILIGCEWVAVDLENGQSADGKVDSVLDYENSDDTTRLKHSNAWRQKFECGKE